METVAKIFFLSLLAVVEINTYFSYKGVDTFGCYLQADQQCSPQRTQSAPLTSLYILHYEIYENKIFDNCAEVWG